MLYLRENPEEDMAEEEVGSCDVEYVGEGDRA